MLEQHGVETVDHSPKMRHFQAQHTQVIWKPKKRNPKSQLVRYHNRETMGNNYTLKFVIVSATN